VAVAAGVGWLLAVVAVGAMAEQRRPGRTRVRWQEQERRNHEQCMATVQAVHIDERMVALRSVQRRPVHSELVLGCEAGKRSVSSRVEPCRERVSRAAVAAASHVAVAAVLQPLRVGFVAS